MAQEQYVVVHQTRDRAPTEYEDLLGDALERIFADGATEVDQVVAGLNDLAAPSPDGQPWTRDLFLSEMKRLGA